MEERVKYEISENSGRTVLTLHDQLTFSDRSAFDELIPQLLRNGHTGVVVDMKDLTYMDSAGLGMLLTLRDRAEKTKAKVAIRGPQGDVKELLRLSCFDTLFAFE